MLMSRIKLTITLTLALMLSGPLSALDSIRLVEDGATHGISPDLLSKNAASFYAKKGAAFDFSKPSQIVILRANLKTESIALEFRQPEKYSIWVWFDANLNVIVRESPFDIGGSFIPPSPQLSD
jgi:hypothetical protein